MSTTQAIHTSEIWMHKAQKPDLLRPSISQMPQFPSYRFSCPSCGSLEVFISWQDWNTPSKGQCLDCKNEWKEIISWDAKKK